MKTAAVARSILGLQEGLLTRAVVQEAYRAKAKLTHPDASGGSTKAFKLVNEAHKLLIKNLKRDGGVSGKYEAARGWKAV